jgi:hypothetical protein
MCLLGRGCGTAEFVELMRHSVRGEMTEE